MTPLRWFWKLMCLIRLHSRVEIVGMHTLRCLDCGKWWTE